MIARVEGKLFCSVPTLPFSVAVGNVDVSAKELLTGVVDAALFKEIIVAEGARTVVKKSVIAAEVVETAEVAAAVKETAVAAAVFQVVFTAAVVEAGEIVAKTVVEAVLLEPVGETGEVGMLDVADVAEEAAVEAVCKDVVVAVAFEE